MLLRLAILGVATAASGVHAFFRMPCAHLVSERVDPIVNPGAISGHVHTATGGSAFNLTQSFESSRAAKCTSCKAIDDRSNYWTPSLYYQAQNGSFHDVPQVGGMLIYYLQRRASSTEKLRAFPPGFRMLAGDNGVRAYNASNLAQRAVSWVCLDYGGTGAGGETKEMPNHRCPNGLRSQVFFPSCWDGVNLDSPDHKSHVAYPDGMDNGKCPSTHPVRLVSIFFETIWDTPKFANMWWKSDGTHPFVLANGDPTGYAYHGDFLNGWDVDALQRAVDGCNQDSGVIEDCSSILRLQDDATMNDCAIPSQIDERITGWLDSLPGCNPVQSGPGRAAAATCTGKPTPAVLPADQVSFMKNDVPLWDPVGCAKDDLNNRLLPKKYTPGGMTIEKCTAQCQAAGYKYAGLQYASECWCGSTFDETKANLVGSCNMPCQGDPTEMCGAGAILSVYKYNPNKVVGTKPSTTAQPPPPPSSSSAAPPPAASSSAAPPPPVTPSSSVVVPSSSVVAPPPGSSALPPKPSSSAAPPKPSSSLASPPPPPASSTVAPPPASSSAAPPPPTPSGGSNGWTSAGCFVDPINPRGLTGTWMWYDVPMTGPACVKHCDQLGYSIAGTEYAGECWCGNKLDKAAVKAPEKECNMKCKGDKSTTCGGAARMNIFTKNKPSKRSIPESLLSKKSSHARIARRHHLRSDLIH